MHLGWVVKDDDDPTNLKYFRILPAATFEWTTHQINWIMWDQIYGLVKHWQEIFLANWRSICQIRQCFPPLMFHAIWYTITVCSNFTINDYSNDDTMKKYIKHIVASTDKYPALFTFDNFKTHCTPAILTLDQNIILTPPNCTHWI